MLKSTRADIIFWLIVASLILVGTIYALLHWNKTDNNVQLDESISISEIDDFVRQATVPVEDDLPPLAQVLTETAEDVHPRDVCEKPLQELSEECLKLLDTYFLDKPFVWRNFDWIPLPLTYRRIFTDPASDRDKVFEALKKPECRLELGEVRWDLKESCHAESFSNYANFLYFCQFVEDKLNNELDMAQSLFYGSGFRPSVYQRYVHWDLENFRSSEWAGERILEGRWIVERTCERFDINALTLDSHQYATLMAIWKRLGDDTGLYDRAFEVLKSMAARLGDEWASSVYESPKENDTWDVHETESLPWKQLLRTMHSTISKPSLEMRSNVRERALEFALEAWGELEKTGLQIDLDRLIDYVCGGNWLVSGDTCETSIAKLKQANTSTDQRFWHRLSIFESRAIQMDLYDVVPRYRGHEWEPDALEAADSEGFHTHWKTSDKTSSR